MCKICNVCKMNKIYKICQICEIICIFDLLMTVHILTFSILLKVRFIRKFNVWPFDIISYVSKH